MVSMVVPNSVCGASSVYVAYCAIGACGVCGAYVSVLSIV